MHSLLKDLRYGIRSLLRHPAFTVIAVITLALGIGANTAIFSVVNGVLLRALPFPNPEQLVSVSKPMDSEGLPGIAAREYLAWQSQSKDFESLAAYSNDNYNLIGLGAPERISCGQVTASFFSTLGVPALRGRVFLPEEDKPGSDNVVVVSEAFWQRRFGGSDSILGSTITLEDKPYTIVGVMPHSFRFPGDYEIWLPMALDPVKETQGDMFRLVEIVGRLRPTVSAEHAQSELNVISIHISQPDKDTLTASGAEIVPLHSFLVAGVRKTVLILWGAVGLLMLLACTNVASLMLSRTVARKREMAVRAAVGARRWQLISTAPGREHRSWCVRWSVGCLDSSLVQRCDRVARPGRTNQFNSRSQQHKNGLASVCFYAFVVSNNRRRLWIGSSIYSFQARSSKRPA